MKTREHVFLWDILFGQILPQVGTGVLKQANAAKMRPNDTIALLSLASDFLQLGSDSSNRELGSVGWFSRFGLTLTQ